MTRGKRQYPSKKKHANRPREVPVVPLTDEQRAAKAQREFDKAIAHLSEAERHAAWGQAPNACAHSAYYAMHHCAAAAILSSGGVGKYRDSPKSHDHVTEHYGALTKAEPGYLGVSGLALIQVQAQRGVADYELNQGVNGREAKSTTLEARRFVDACAARWNLRPSPVSDSSRALDA